MTPVRFIVLILCQFTVALWLVAWLPPEYLPSTIHFLVFWFGGVLTVLLLPSIIGLWWAVSPLVRAAVDAHSRGQS